MEETKLNKIKAIDLNTESLKLYVTIAVAALAGLIAYHNSNNIIHTEWCFLTAITCFLICGILGLVTLNSYITSIDEGKIDIDNKLSLRLNFSAVIFFSLGIVFGAIYLITSKPKTHEIGISTNGISIRDNNIEIGKDVKATIRISKDSEGKIKEINISSISK